MVGTIFIHWHHPFPDLATVYALEVETQTSTATLAELERHVAALFGEPLAPGPALREGASDEAQDDDES